MSPKQEEIYQENPKFFYFYKRNSNQYKKFLIPYTENAKKRAIEQGALFFSSYRSCRHNRQFFPRARKWGDLYIRFTKIGLVTNEGFDSIKNVISIFFSQQLKLHRLDAAKVIILGDMGFGLMVPSEYFQLQGGHPLLPKIYHCVTEMLGNYYAKSFCEKSYKIEKSDLTDIENVNNADRYNIPLTFGEFLSYSYGQVIDLSMSPKNIEGTGKKDVYGSISNNLFRLMIKKAQREDHFDNIGKFLIDRCDLFRGLKKSRFISDPQKPLLLNALEGYAPKVQKFLIEELQKSGIIIGELFPANIISSKTICEKLRTAKLCFNKNCNHKAPSELLNVWSNCVPFQRILKDVSELQKSKCAILILQKLKHRGISEFTSRDALRLVRGSFPTIDEVESGLQLLERHNLLIRFELGDYSYPGRRPAPWFLLNKLWDGKIF